MDEIARHATPDGQFTLLVIPADDLIGFDGYPWHTHGAFQRFVGDYLCSVSISVGGVHFNFGRAGTISVEGRWELVDPAGHMVDRNQDNGKREAYHLHVVLNEDVVDYKIDAPRSFSLTFNRGIN